MSLEYAEDNAEDNSRVLDGRRMSAIEADRRLYARRERLARFTTAKLCDAAGTALPCVMIAAFALPCVVIAALSCVSFAALPCVMIAALPCVMRRVREIASRERQALSLRAYIRTSRPLFVSLSVLTDVHHRRYKTDSQTLGVLPCAVQHACLWSSTLEMNFSVRQARRQQPLAQLRKLALEQILREHTNICCCGDDTGDVRLVDVCLTTWTFVHLPSLPHQRCARTVHWACSWRLFREDPLQAHATQRDIAMRGRCSRAAPR